MLLKGRRKIMSEYKPDDLRQIGTLANEINSALAIHYSNKSEIDYLMSYQNGIQPILERTKLVREEINNHLIINHAQMITRMITGYFLGTPIQYVQNGKADKKSEIEELNSYVAYEDKAAVDKEIGEFQAICGTAYRIIYTDGVMADEVPFEDKALDPSTTFVVYENTIAEKPLFAVTYFSKFDANGDIDGIHMYVYTTFGLYTIVTNRSGWVDDQSQIEFAPYDVGGVPIIEYPNNRWRIGDWELCIGLMDGINSLQSDRMDDIDQIVQSLIVFINAEVDPETYDTMRKKGVVMLTNKTDKNTAIDTIQNTLDQGGMNLYSEELEALLYALIGIPDRKSRGGGGGDTGQAVELRDGWADLEIVARNKEVIFKRSEKQALKIILTIMKNKLGTNLSLLDVDIKFSRNKNNNLLVKSQSYSTLLATKTLSPADCLTIVDLVSDVSDYISRGEAFWGDNFAGLGMLDATLKKANEPTPAGNPLSTPLSGKPSGTKE